MALTHSQIFIALLIVSCFVSTVVLGYRTNDVKWWCGKTPNPVPCEYYLSKNMMIKDEVHFLKISMQLALDHAIHAQSNIHSLGPKCRNELEKAAWSDCLKLYELTILGLNKAVDFSPNVQRHDRQTWLSAALTNLETCRDGFIELGVSDYLPPMMSNNVSELISNTMALNKAPYKEPTYKDGFPTWVKHGDSKLLQSSSSLASQADIVVAQDGSGIYKTINEAISAASSQSGSGRYVIYVKAGTYSENVEIGSDLKNIMMVGDGMGKTIITGNKSVGVEKISTFNTATVGVDGESFIGRDITFRNTAGPNNGQAVALRSGSDHSVFYRCSFEGYQDTLYVFSHKQFYRECDVYGTVDFIFGKAAVVLQNCNIYARNPPSKINTVTAQGRSNVNDTSGITIQNSTITAASDLKPVQGSVKTFLGRPWKQFSTTVIIKTFLDTLIDPAGWMEWNQSLDTLYYAEYMNTGPGSFTSNRVKWKGYHVLTNATEASAFTVGNFIDGNSWLPTTGVPFTLGL
ncbi:pectinesterase 2-like [Hibiscus syriacus]|uniref:pectinesterase 2-like n=1 Tax=Hibiscus syriacus TaxID=106335 RepID=UPI00192154F1|nr:pectinesterase 2-like [Hibiscus syriacus]